MLYSITYMYSKNKQTHISYQQLGLHLKVSNIYKSYDFYNKLGMIEVFAYGNEKFLSTVRPNIPSAKEKYNGVRFDIGNGVIEIADGHVAVKPEVFKRKISSSKVSAMMYVSSVSAIQDLCEKYDFPVAVPIRDYYWGTRELVLKDPDGFVLVFIEMI